MICAPSEDWSAWASAHSDQSSLFVWRNIGPLHVTTYRAHREDWSGWQMPRLIQSLRWARFILLVLSCSRSFNLSTETLDTACLCFLLQIQVELPLPPVIHFPSDTIDFTEMTVRPLELMMMMMKRWWFIWLRVQLSCTGAILDCLAVECCYNNGQGPPYYPKLHRQQNSNSTTTTTPHQTYCW